MWQRWWLICTVHYITNTLLSWEYPGLALMLISARGDKFKCLFARDKCNKNKTTVIPCCHLQFLSGTPSNQIWLQQPLVRYSRRRYLMCNWRPHSCYFTLKPAVTFLFPGCSLLHLNEHFNTLLTLLIWTCASNNRKLMTEVSSWVSLDFLCVSINTCEVLRWNESRHRLYYIQPRREPHIIQGQSRNFS